MNGFSYMAMTDYPYETSFLQPMPPNPVNVACQAFDGIPVTAPKTTKTTVGALSTRENQVLNALYQSANVYFNYTGQINCTDFSDGDATGALEGAGWNVLACNQMAMPTTNGANSMFIPNDPFDTDAYTKQCQEAFGLTPRYDWVWDYFGGKDIQRDFASHTNIIFTNGDLDPWSAGGVNTAIKNNDRIKIIPIAGAAHHLELRGPNPADPQSVIDARTWILGNVTQWITEYNNIVQLQ